MYAKRSPITNYNTARQVKWLSNHEVNHKVLPATAQATSCRGQAGRCWGWRCMEGDRQHRLPLETASVCVCVCVCVHVRA